MAVASDAKWWSVRLRFPSFCLVCGRDDRRSGRGNMRKGRSRKLRRFWRTASAVPWCQRAPSRTNFSFPGRKTQEERLAWPERCGRDANSCGRFARSVAMITHSRVVGSCLISGTTGLIASGRKGQVRNPRTGLETFRNCANS